MLAFELSENTISRPLSLTPRDSFKREKVVYGSHNGIYQDISVVKCLDKSSLYVVTSNVTKLKYIMKIFPHQKARPQIFFRNECRFASLRHPNIVKSLYFEKEREVNLNDVPMTISYIIREYASNGDLLDFLKKNAQKLDEKCARTYFRQLIDGLEYLHKNTIAHMNLRLDNIFVDQDYCLKISNFDVAHYGEDAIILSNGTKYFRAPELINGKCSNTKAADIFSAGILLFTLYAKGILPQFEDNLIESIDFASLMYHDPKKFWAYHTEVQKQNKTSFAEEFKELFLWMTKVNPQERPSTEEIKASKWYNGPYYSIEELKEKIESFSQ